MTVFDVPDDVPVYVISVAAQLSGLHPQTLRQYDRLGLVSPGRTVGGGRLYSLRDIEQVREVQRLSAEGMNLAGIKQVLELEDRVSALRSRVAELADEVRTLRAELARRDAQHGYRRTYLPMRVEERSVALWPRTSGPKAHPGGSAQP